ncbi:MAG: dockerin type I domain-containing protein [Kofleriaceae bacterium]
MLLDASFSMSTARNNADGKGAIRWEAAKSFAADRIHENEIITDVRPLKVAVYSFRGDDQAPILHTNGFADPQEAKDAIECLTENPAGVPATDVDCNTTHDAGLPFELGGISAGNTPLALALCQSADTLAAFAGDGKILRLFSDGEENSSLTSLCAGDPGVVGVYDPVGKTWGPAGSWQAKSIGYYLSKGIIVKTDLLETPPIVFPTLVGGGRDLEGVAAPADRLRALTVSASTGLNPLEQFFTSLAEATGGDVTITHDDELLPVLGDQNGDRCVDHTDAIAVARAFGPIVPPATGAFDFNGDGVVDFSDYLSQLAHITGTCGSDPYVARAPIVCTGGTRVVIDGQSLEDEGITIDARGACQITIKNSLIVSGKNAITIVGTATITVDNSVIVGQTAVISQRGSGVLSAANSKFHGKLDTKGAFIYVNRGGNIFE